MPKHSPRLFGFTLLELLVVISIIGILVAMGAASFSIAQKQGRDARRRGDMKAFQNCMEQKRVARTAPSLHAYLNTERDECMTGLNDPNGTAYTAVTTGPQHAKTGYCACAKLDQARGNSNNSNCDITSGNDGQYFCVQELQ